MSDELVGDAKAVGILRRVLGEATQSWHEALARADVLEARLAYLLRPVDFPEFDWERMEAVAADELCKEHDAEAVRGELRRGRPPRLPEERRLLPLRFGQSHRDLIPAESNRDPRKPCTGPKIE